MFDLNVQISTFFDPLVESEDSDSNSSGAKESRAPGANDRGSSRAAKYLESPVAKERGSPVAKDLEAPGAKKRGSRAAKDLGALGSKERGSRGAKDLDVLGPNDFQIPVAFDPFAEDKDVVGATGIKEYVHIRIQQRNGKKNLTTIQGLKKEFSYEKILKDLKKEFCCNGNVVQDKELGKVIQLQGDQRKNVSQFLVNADIVMKEQIKIHGF